jgi:hypothetical protein
MSFTRLPFVVLLLIAYGLWLLCGNTTEPGWS